MPAFNVFLYLKDKDLFPSGKSIRRNIPLKLVRKFFPQKRFSGERIFDSFA